MFWQIQALMTSCFDLSSHSLPSNPHQELLISELLSPTTRQRILIGHLPRWKLMVQNGGIPAITSSLPTEEILSPNSPNPPETSPYLRNPRGDQRSDVNAKTLLSRRRTQLPNRLALLAQIILCVKIIRIGLQACLADRYCSDDQWLIEKSRECEISDRPCRLVSKKKYMDVWADQTHDISEAVITFLASISSSPRLIFTWGHQLVVIPIPKGHADMRNVEPWT